MQISAHDDGRIASVTGFTTAMSPPADKPRASYDDVLRAPDTVIAEILEGELVTSPRPTGPHGTAHTNLIIELGPAFCRGRGGPGGWLLVLEPELHLNDPVDVVVPDLAGWRVERMPEVPEGVEFRVPPDWVCELLSLSTERIDRTRKLRIYARAGVRHVWLVSAIARTLEVLRLDGGRWTLLDVYADEDVVRAEPFDAVALDLALLWAGPVP
jgi:Uma2 family endonuclease